MKKTIKINSNKTTRTTQEKTNLIESILNECNVTERLKPNMKRTLLKLSHKDLSDLAFGFVICK